MGKAGEHSQNGKSNNSFFRQPDRPSPFIACISLILLWLAYLLYAIIDFFIANEKGLLSVNIVMCIFCVGLIPLVLWTLIILPYAECGRNNSSKRTD